MTNFSIQVNPRTYNVEITTYCLEMGGIVIKKRIAYVGLSYPIRYDITKRTKSWLVSSTAQHEEAMRETYPIIESPWGLMLLYDELWFLCEDVCPFNMRHCSFTKYVTDMFPGIDYLKIMNQASQITRKPQNVYASMEEHYAEFCKSTIYHTVTTSKSIECQVGKVKMESGSYPDNFLFDILIKTEIERRSKKKIELISNGNIDFEGYISNEGMYNLSNELILNRVPNYITHEGPYHPVIDEIRGSSYMTDYRRWICDYHSHISMAEVEEIKTEVERKLKEIQETTFLRYMELSSKKSFYESTAKTVISTIAGTMPVIGIPISIVSAIVDIAADVKNTMRAQNDRWAAFITESRIATKKYGL